MARPKDLGLEHASRLRVRPRAQSGLSIPEFWAPGGIRGPSRH